MLTGVGVKGLTVNSNLPSSVANYLEKFTDNLASVVQNRLEPTISISPGTNGREAGRFVRHGITSGAVQNIGITTLVGDPGASTFDTFAIHVVIRQTQGSNTRGGVWKCIAQASGANLTIKTTGTVTADVTFGTSPVAPTVSWSSNTFQVNINELNCGYVIEAWIFGRPSGGTSSATF
jgi:hypothetical protein